MGALIDAFPQAMAFVFDPYTLGVGLLATMFGSVSYTHLDVYKRQVHPTAEVACTH